MRRVLFTEQQMKQILGEEEFSSYLPEYGEEIPSTDSNVFNYAEVIPTDDIDNKIPHTQDYDANQRRRVYPYGFRPSGAGTTGICESGKKKELNERSEETEKYHTSGTKGLKDRIQQSGTTNKTLNNIVTGEGDRLGTWETRLSRLRSAKRDNPQQYQAMGGKKTEASMSNIVANAQGITNDKNKSQIPQMPTNKQTSGTSSHQGGSNKPTIYYDAAE